MSAPTKTKLKTPPDEIELIYQTRGDSHVFTATGYAGFYYSSTSLETSFNEIANALSMHVTAHCGQKTVYTIPMSLAAFKKCVAADNDSDDVADLVCRNSLIATVTHAERRVS